MQTSIEPLASQSIFPPYLALGKLKVDSIHPEEDFQVAEYQLLGHTVHVVKIATGKAHFYDVFEGKKGAESVHQDLKKAVLQHFMFCNPAKQPAFFFLYRSVCGLGNIYFQHLIEDKSKVTMISYPAARLFILRLPVTYQNILHAEELLKDNYIDECFHDLYETTITIFRKDGTKETESIWLMEFLVPMAFVFDVAKVMVEKEVILSDKTFRLIIQDAGEKASAAIHILFGAEKDNWKSYMLKYETVNRP